jgi:hypothetical protein
MRSSCGLPFRSSDALSESGGITVDPDTRAFTPHQTEHINRFGRYTFKRDRIPEPLDDVRVLRMLPPSEGIEQAAKAAV